jgi:hypothetical protein
VKYSLFVSSMTVVAVIGGFAAPARADECDKLTYLTFSAPVALPGVTLPAGTYRFTHPDCVETSHLLRVSSEDGSHVYATLLTVPADRLTPSARPEVILAEMPARTPEVIKAWFYPGETVGDELIYPENEARRVADATQRTVFASRPAV